MLVHKLDFLLHVFLNNFSCSAFLFVYLLMFYTNVCIIITQMIIKNNLLHSFLYNLLFSINISYNSRKYTYSYVKTYSTHCLVTFI